MGQAEKRAAADKKRTDIIVQGIKDGMSVKALAARIGVEEDYAKRLRKTAAADHGLTVAEGESPATPFGFTADSADFRLRLRNKLVNLVEMHGHHPVEVAMMVGISEKAQKRNAGKASNNHDWKISELERLAAAYNMTFLELMAEVTRPRKPGELI